jgi:hypothetical protein
MLSSAATPLSADGAINVIAGARFPNVPTIRRAATRAASNILRIVSLSRVHTERTAETLAWSWRRSLIFKCPTGPRATKQRCRARPNRTGQPCRAPAVRGWQVCRMHGARVAHPKSKRNGNFRHGHEQSRVLQSACEKLDAMLPENSRGGGVCVKHGSARHRSRRLR